MGVSLYFKVFDDSRAYFLLQWCLQLLLNPSVITEAAIRRLWEYIIIISIIGFGCFCGDAVATD